MEGHDFTHGQQNTHTTLQGISGRLVLGFSLKVKIKSGLPHKDFRISELTVLNDGVALKPPLAMATSFPHGGRTILVHPLHRNS